jgi:hypothetical protein
MVNGMLKIALDKMVELSSVKKIEVKDSSAKKSKKKFLTEADEYDQTAEKL